MPDAIYSLQREFVGAVTVSTSGENLFSDLDILGSVAVVTRVMARVTTALTDAGSLITVKWRPDLGSGTFTELVQFTLPVSSIGDVFEVKVEDGTLTASSTTVSQPEPGKAIGVEERHTADGFTKIGPDGELSIESDGGSTAGAAEFWIEVQALPVQGTLPKTDVTNVTPV